MKINHNGIVVNLPDFYIAGATKSGTTSLYYYFKKYNKIYFPEIKEPSYFSDIVNPHNKGISTLEDYAGLYAKASSGQLLGDASPGYIYYNQNFIKNINSIYGDHAEKIKIFIVLRNPIDRAYSNYKARIRDGLEDKTFIDAINASLNHDGYDYVGLGMYSEQVQSFMENFSHVYVYLFDDFRKDNGVVHADICRRLNIDYKHNISSQSVFNKSGVPKSEVFNKYFVNNGFFKRVLRFVVPQKYRNILRHKVNEVLLKDSYMNQEERKYLENIYSGEIEKLKNIVKIDLNWK